MDGGEAPRVVVYNTEGMMDEIDSRLHKQGSVLDQMWRRSAARLQRANDLQALVDRVLGPSENSESPPLQKSQSEPTHQYKSVISSRRFRARNSMSVNNAQVQHALSSSPANAQPRVRPSSPPQRHFAVLDESPDTHSEAPCEEQRFQKVLEEAKVVKEQRAEQQLRADALLSMQRLRALAAKDLNTYSDLVHNQQKKTQRPQQPKQQGKKSTWQGW
eukprot:INCI2686.2.p1 GENE.INCI2686.2~~INCI2686.2.p1  ORF type:complete len:217 (+),score=34.42 INCI2686.2:61-711(+)